MADICKAETEIEVKCSPHKFYECMKYSFHHLPTMFPEGYTHGEVLEGDGQSEGTLRHFRYKLPGSNEEMVVKPRTRKQDDENMRIEMQVEEGDLHSHYAHFTAVVQVYPKGDGSLVKWTVEFEKHNDEIPDPHLYLEHFSQLTAAVDAHLHSKA